MAVRTPTSQNERGAALVEFAIISVVLIVLAFGILEYGALFRSTIDVAGITRDAARTGTSSTNKAITDQAILQTIISRDATSVANIERVVIYQAQSGTSAPPAACLTAYPAPASEKCNIYRGEDLQGNSSSWEATQGASSWPAATRLIGRQYLGVYIEVRHNKLADLVWSPDRFSDFVAMRVEPPVKGSLNGLPENWTTGNTKNGGFPESYKCIGNQCSYSNGGTGTDGSNDTSGSA